MFIPNDPGHHGPWDSGHQAGDPHPWESPRQPPEYPTYHSHNMFGDLNRDGREDSRDDLLGLAIVSHLAQRRRREVQGDYSGSGGGAAAVILTLIGVAVVMFICLASALQ